MQSLFSYFLISFSVHSIHSIPVPGKAALTETSNSTAPTHGRLHTPSMKEAIPDIVIADTMSNFDPYSIGPDNNSKNAEISSCVLSNPYCAVFSDTVSCCMAFVSGGMGAISSYADAHLNRLAIIPKLIGNYDDICVRNCNQVRPEVHLFGNRGIRGYCEALCTGLNVDIMNYLNAANK